MSATARRQQTRWPRPMTDMAIRCTMVSVVVVRNPRSNPQVLLVRRAGAYLNGVWSYVAGHIEAGETGWQTAQRELAEETGIAPQALYATSFCEQFYATTKDCIMLVPAFVAFADRDCEVRLNDEHSAFRWLSLDAAMPELPFGGQRALFAYVRREFVERQPSPHLLIDLT